MNTPYLAKRVHGALRYCYNCVNNNPARPQHLAACGLSAAEVARVVDDLAALAHPVRLAFRWRPRLSEPNDDMVLETAVNGNAHAIVTFNRRDFEGVSRDFGCACGIWDGISLRIHLNILMRFLLSSRGARRCLCRNPAKRTYAAKSDGKDALSKTG